MINEEKLELLREIVGWKLEEFESYDDQTVLYFYKDKRRVFFSVPVGLDKLDLEWNP